MRDVRYNVSGLVQLVTACGCSKHVHPPQTGIMPEIIRVPMQPESVRLSGYMTAAELIDGLRYREFRRDRRKPWIYREEVDDA